VRIVRSSEEVLFRSTFGQQAACKQQVGDLGDEHDNASRCSGMRSCEVILMDVMCWCRVRGGVVADHLDETGWSCHGQYV